MYRLAFLPIAMAIGAAGHYFEMSYIGYGVISGIAIAMFSLLWEQEDQDVVFGLSLIIIALLFLIASLYFSSSYNFSFEELSKTRDVSRLVQSLPYIAICLGSAGIFICIYKHYRAK
jgi:hypothetical protein